MKALVTRTFPSPVGAAAPPGARRGSWPWVRAATRASIVLAGLFTLGAGCWTAGALGRIAAVESGRDQWQRPAAVVQALGLGPNAVVADIGSGVGYFTLKVAPQVAPDGAVLAVDQKRLPLLMVSLRALLSGRARQVSVIRADAAAVRLPPAGVNAVLIANTYHELPDPQPVLARAREALVAGGRVVLVDPGPDGTASGHAPGAHHYEKAAAAEAQLRRAGFDIVTRDDHFIPAGEGTRNEWWLLVARKP